MSSRNVHVKAAIVVAVIFFSIQFVTPLTTPITSPVIVTLSSDQQASYTANKVNQLLNGKAFVVSSSDPIGNLFILQRAVGEVIYVGHGTPREVKVGESLMSWETFAERNLMTLQSQQVYIAACYSSKASDILAQKYGHSNVVMSFKGLVDTDEAAYLVTSAIAITEGDISAAKTMIGELCQVMTGKVLTPEKYNHWLLSFNVDDDGGGTGYSNGWSGNAYYQWVRSLYFVKYGGYPSSSNIQVAYTHPDVYRYYSWIGVNTPCTISGANLVAVHTTKTQLDSSDLFTMIWSACEGFGTAVAGAMAVLAPVVAVMAAALVIFVGFAEYLIMTYLIRDETGSCLDSLPELLQLWQHHRGRH